MLNQKKLDTKILTAINDIMNTLTTNGTELLFDINSQGNPYMRWTKERNTLPVECNKYTTAVSQINRWHKLANHMGEIASIPERGRAVC